MGLGRRHVHASRYQRAAEASLPGLLCGFSLHGRLEMGWELFDLLLPERCEPHSLLVSPWSRAGGWAGGVCLCLPLKSEVPRPNWQGGCSNP